MPQLGNFALGNQENGGLGSPNNQELPSYTVVIGADNKSIISRTGINNYRMLFAPRTASPYSENMEPLSFAITHLGITPCASDLGFSKIIAAEKASNSPWLYGDCSSSQLNQSSVQCPPCVAAPQPSDIAGPTWFEQDPHLMGGAVGIGALVDDQGRHYMMYRYHPFTTGSLTYHAIMRSTDYTQETWEVVLNLGPTGLNILPSSTGANQGCIFAKGYLWYIGARTNSSFSSSNDLVRIDVDGGTVQITTINWGVQANIVESKFDALSNNQNRYELAHSPGTDKIFGTNYNYVYRQSDNAVKAAPIMYIDISDVDNPVVTFSSFEPFGANHPSSYIQAFDNNTYIAKVWHHLPENPTSPQNPHARWDQGAIYRTTNGGSTWTAVQSFSANLGASTSSALLPTSSTVHRNEAFYAYQTVAIADENTVFVAGGPPYIYRSDDKGLTWTIETVDMSIYTPYITGIHDEAADQFTSINICRSCDVIISAMMPIMVTLMGAN